MHTPGRPKQAVAQLRFPVWSFLFQRKLHPHQTASCVEFTVYRRVSEASPPLSFWVCCLYFTTMLVIMSVNLPHVGNTRPVMADGSGATLSRSRHSSFFYHCFLLINQIPPSAHFSCLCIKCNLFCFVLKANKWLRPPHRFLSLFLSLGGLWVHVSARLGSSSRLPHTFGKLSSCWFSQLWVVVGRDMWPWEFVADIFMSNCLEVRRMELAGFIKADLYAVSVLWSCSGPKWNCPLLLFLSSNNYRFEL